MSRALGWAPDDNVCCSSSYTATASAWHPDALHQQPRTSPGSVGRSKPRLQPSSRDHSSKSRHSACSLTGTRQDGTASGTVWVGLGVEGVWAWVLGGEGRRERGGRDCLCVPGTVQGLPPGGQVAECRLWTTCFISQLCYFLAANFKQIT